MHSPIETIKARVRKLLDLAGDGGAFDGEITAAMQAAERLMNEYHLERADCEAQSQERGASPTADTFDRVQVTSRGKTFSTWEGVLASAIADLVGTVRVYRSSASVGEGLFGKPSVRPVAVFFGPDDDARLAGELFAEWQVAIATLAYGKYGACMRGDGGQYAYGFACALALKAGETVRARQAITTAATTALALVCGGTLAALHAQTRDKATAWLAAQGVRLGSRGGSAHGPRGGSHDAYSAGRSDGARAEFGAKRQARIGGVA